MDAWRTMSIPISQIEVDLPDSNDRTFNEEFCRDLARSIESDGLLHPLLVMPRGSGRYKLIAGRHRLQAVSNYLRWTEIDCKVVEDVDDEMALSMTLAENIFVQRLEDFQLQKALRRWWESYHRRNPRSEGRGSHMKRERKEVSRVTDPLHFSSSELREDQCDEAGRIDRGEAAPSSVTPPSQGLRLEQSPLSFYRVVESGLGVSSPTAQRLARVAKNLTMEQIDVLEKHGVTQGIAHRLAGLDNEEAIQSAIDLIASGRNPTEVVQLASKSKKTAGQTRINEASSLTGVKGAKATAILKSPKPPEQSDDEWLSEHCSNVLGMLTRKGPFKRDAVLYRRLADILPGMRRSVKKALAEARSADGNGGFYASLVRVVRAAGYGQELCLENPQAAGFSLMPSMKTVPLMTSASSGDPFNDRQLFDADSISL